jgi:acyl carrier protein
MHKNTHFGHDLRANSLDPIKLIISIGETFGIEIQMKKLRNESPIYNKE